MFNTQYSIKEFMIRKLKSEILFVTCAFVVAIAIATNEVDASKMSIRKNIISCMPSSSAKFPMPSLRSSSVNQPSLKLRPAMRSSVIGPRSSNKEDEKGKEFPWHNKNPGDNGNCPHQQPASIICNISNSKNKLFKIPTC